VSWCVTGGLSNKLPKLQPARSSRHKRKSRQCPRNRLPMARMRSGRGRQNELMMRGTER
jgi:hypothetical protein